MSRLRRLRGIGRRLLQKPLRYPRPVAIATASEPLTSRSLTPEAGTSSSQQLTSTVSAQEPILTSGLLASKAHILPDEAYDVLTETLKHSELALSIFGVEALVGYEFKDRSLLWEALTDCNRRLAVVGDAVLTLCLASDMHSQGESPRVLLFVLSPSPYSTHCYRITRSSSLYLDDSGG